ncbi:MAG: NAD(P)/FAD-dependent oxidoreductase [Candidatus Woesearchaeota archaeon]
MKRKGVSYCAICDGAFFKDAVVAVNGGGNTALEDAMYLNKIAKKVYLIHRRDNFRADQIIIDDLNRTLKSPDNKIEIIYDSVVKSINGKNMLESITVFNKKTNKEKNIKLDGFFIAIGRTPSTELVKGQVELTYDGYIKTNQHLETNIKGVYAAGDIREKEVRQIITAASDGAVASTYASSYLRKIKK